MVKVEVEALSAVKRRLAIEVPAERITAEIDRAYAELGRQAEIRGFRRGRAPRAMLERHYGDRVRGEVYSRVIQDSVADAVRERAMRVVGSPEVVTDRAAPGEAFRFAATVEVYPEVEATGYAGLALDRVVFGIGESDVDRYLTGLREALAQLRPIEGRTVVERGDVAIIDYEARVDDRLVGRGEARPCEVGRGGFPDGFEARLLGAEVGQTAEFPCAFPPEERNPEFAGRTVNFKVRVRGLASKSLPALDDEFAKDQGDCDTLAELRAKIRQRLEVAAAHRSEEMLRRVAVDKVVAANEFEVPASMVERQTEQLIMEVVEGWRGRRIWPEDEAAAFASLREELRPRAEREVKAAVLLDAIGRQEQIEVSEDDVTREIERTAREAGDGGERVRALLGSAEGRRGVAERLRSDRVVTFVIERAQITIVEPERNRVADGGESR